MCSLAAFALLIIGVCVGAHARYLGRELGALRELHHGVRGRVFAVDARTLFLQDFHYDGEGPAAYFYVGTSKTPSAAGGIRLRDERGASTPLRRYRGESVTLSLPDGKTLRDVKWFAVWCDEYAINFGDVSIPRDLEYPKPARVGALRGVHGVSSDAVVVVDAQTLLVPNFSYDGEAPDAKFWVGRGAQPSPQGIRIPDENGKEAPLRRYDRKTIVLTLPGELTVFDIGHFAVWCEAFTVNFGHVPLPRAALANVPPSLKMLGVSPQSKLNCEVLFDELAFEVRWAVAGDSVVIQLVAKLEDGEYMSFGVSGDSAHSQMVGADVAVAWVNKATLKGYAVDYYLDAKSQCAGVRGSCPDERLGENTNSIRLLNAALVNGYSIVTYQRSLKAADELDLAVVTNASQPVVWALGPLNSRNEVSYHHHFTKGDKFIEFGRAPVWNCPMPESEDENHEPPAKEPTPAKPSEEIKEVTIIPNPVPTPKPVPQAQPWDIPAIQCYEPPDGVFYAQMGPTGGKQGYPAITGHVGWGISWYINGLLIPEINVVRGKQYTFVVEGGSDPAVPAKYHPFYITNDPVGGYMHKSDKEKKGVEIYAGLRRSRTGDLQPTGVGRACNWTPDTSGPQADEFPSFGAYQRSLTLVCEPGNPGIVTWTPDKNTPNTVYYQCYTHRYLGWKINVLDECDAEDGEESRVAVRVIAPPADLRGEESVQVHSRVSPDSNFLDHRKKVEKIINTKMNYNDFSNIKNFGLPHPGGPNPPESAGSAPYSGQEFELPISKVQIKEVIQAVESLESKMKDEMRRNTSHPQQTYQVYEDKEGWPERPLRDGDELVVEKQPEHFLLPPAQAPLTLQAVLRPKLPTGARPMFRRPSPPEIKLRRPPPGMKGGNMGYPLSMPNVHGGHGMHKKPYPPKHNGNRPPPNMNRPPLLPGVTPMKPMPPMHHQPIFNQVPPKQVKLPKNPIIMGKPGPSAVHVQTNQLLNLGQTDIIANQVVKSQITLPGVVDSAGEHSIPQVLFNKPGQIILGKPMDNPLPLDQQMTQTKHQIFKIPEVSPPSHTIIKVENDRVPPTQNEIKSSDFIGESVPEFSTLRPAVNTGFKPDSIVVESGFKPIIREPLMAAEDRIADGSESGTSNRREDTDVVEDYDESPQFINHQYPSDKVTQNFEPMFIPSPPDHLLSTGDSTKEVFPKNHAKEDRPHPVYVKTEEELNALFGKKNMDKEAPFDMVMESDRISPHYLPPDPKLNKEVSQKLSKETESMTFTTYDGKTISASALPDVPGIGSGPKIYSSKLPSNSDLLMKTPQFGPFKGQIPPIIDKSSSVGLTPDQMPQSADTNKTHLKLVNTFLGADLDAAGSEIDEVNNDEYENEEELEEGNNNSNIRKKRESKTTQFEREEGTTTIGHTEQGTDTSDDASEARSHVEFETQQLPTSHAVRPVVLAFPLTLLLLCLRLV